MYSFLLYLKQKSRHSNLASSSSLPICLQECCWVRLNPGPGASSGSPIWAAGLGDLRCGLPGTCEGAGTPAKAQATGCILRGAPNTHLLGSLTCSPCREPRLCLPGVRPRLALLQVSAEGHPQVQAAPSLLLQGIHLPQRCLHTLQCWKWSLAEVCDHCFLCLSGTSGLGKIQVCGPGGTKGLPGNQVVS